MSRMTRPRPTPAAQPVRRRSDIADRVLWLEDGTFRELDAMAYDPVCGMTAPTTPG